MFSSSSKSKAAKYLFGYKIFLNILMAISYLNMTGSLWPIIVPSPINLSCYRRHLRDTNVHWWCCNDDEGSLAVIRPDTVDTGWWWSPDTMIPGPGSLTSSASVSSLLSHLPENPPNVECFRFQHKTAQILDRKCFKFFQGDFWSMMNDLSFLIWYHIVIHILFFRSYSEWDIFWANCFVFVYVWLLIDCTATGEDWDFFPRKLSEFCSLTPRLLLRVNTG